MDTDAILTIVAQYAPTILAVACIVINTISQKTNLFNGLKVLYQKADEFNKSAQFKEIQDKMTTLTITVKEQEEVIKDLTDSIRGIAARKKE